MGCVQCPPCFSRPPAAPWQSSSGEVVDVLGDARLLADYTVFLVEEGDDEGIQDLWELEFRRNDAELASDAAERLADSWQAYRASPTGHGNFDDTREWQMHHLPGKNIVQRVRSKSLVGQEDEMYTFAVAAMVGLHVATICSALIDDHRKDASIFGEDYDDLLVENSRRYKIPVQGSAYSPKLILVEPFEIEEFAPTLFAELRALSGVSNADYMDSLCRIDFEFIRFGSNSKSGEFFFFSYDQLFLLKTATPGEAETLLNMLLDIRERITEEPRSMLGRYLGLYRMTLSGKSRIFFVMRAIPAVARPVHRRYDLKGSTRNRRSKKGESVGKDVNFHEEMGALGLTTDVARELVEIHEKDVELLKEHAIMDYSILCFVHDSLIEAAPEVPTNKRATSCRKQHLQGGPAMVSLRRADTQPVLRPGEPTLLERGRTMAGGLGNSRDRSISCGALAGGALGVPEGEGCGNPHYGVRSADCMKTYFFGIIDMLVAYTLYPKVQYHGTHVITCGKAHKASRIPPVSYADRQAKMFRKVCGVPRQPHSRRTTSDEAETSEDSESELCISSDDD